MRAAIAADADATERAQDKKRKAYKATTDAYAKAAAARLKIDEARIKASGRLGAGLGGVTHAIWGGLRGGATALGAATSDASLLATIEGEGGISGGASPEMEGLMKKFLPFLDGLERVLFLGRSHPQTDEIANWLTSVESLYFRLVNTLEKFGLKAIDAVDKPVNLECQEVVEYIPTREHGHNVVIKERQKGYYYQGKLLRDAQVVVANNP